jgi:sugar lactone lactonase YvrE
MSPLYSGGFPEGLRWRDGELWLSDMFRRVVVSIDASGRRRSRAFIPGQPSGLGWLPDGTLLISSMLDGHVVACRADTPRILASPGTLTTGPTNDMLVDAAGRAYVGSLGFDPAYGGLTPEELGPTSVGSTIDAVPLIMVQPTGEMTVVADDLAVPNGMALVDHGRTLIVAETLRRCLTAFDVDGDGGLSGRRNFAMLPAPVDGICTDGQDAVWASQLMDERFVRVADGGRILAEVRTPGRTAVDCVLGGADGATMFASVVEGPMDFWTRGEIGGTIEAFRVEVPGPASR